MRGFSKTVTTARPATQNVKSRLGELGVEALSSTLEQFGALHGQRDHPLGQAHQGREPRD